MLAKGLVDFEGVISVLRQHDMKSYAGGQDPMHSYPRPGLHSSFNWVCGWVGPRGSLNIIAKDRNLALSTYQASVFQTISSNYTDSAKLTHSHL
jgi:hypothetical protein